MLGEIWSVICGGIFALKITDMPHSHGIEITDVLRDYYKLPEVPQVILIPCEWGSRLRFSDHTLIVTRGTSLQNCDVVISVESGVEEHAQRKTVHINANTSMR